LELRWIAAIFAWLSVGATTSACAFAWGAEGRSTVLLIGLFGFLFAGFTTGGISSGTKNAKPNV
jgi:hypothetical protein